MTEKNYNPEQRNTKALKKQEVAIATPEFKKAEETKITKEKTPETSVKEEKKQKVPEVKKQIIKKEFAIANLMGVPVSTLDAIYICKFIKYKTIEKAISDLEEVIKKKKPVPMKGEIPHRRGKGMMSGRFPINASKEFILILKGLKGNSIVNGLENPVISEAIANFAPRPFGRFGSIRRKRTHIKLVARDKRQKVKTSSSSKQSKDSSMKEKTKEKKK